MLLAERWTSYPVGHHHLQRTREEYITSKEVVCVTLYPGLSSLHLQISKLNNFGISFFVGKKKKLKI